MLGSMNGVHLALLRGINVGGKNKLPMKALVALVEGAGCESVRTYIQSGNVVFRASAARAQALPAALSKALRTDFGYTIAVVTRTATELEQALAANPFVDEGADPTSLYIAFLAARPTKAHAGALDPERSPDDRFRLIGRELYLCLPNGVARTKLTNAWIDKALATISTVRNWRTCAKLLELARAT